MYGLLKVVWTTLLRFSGDLVADIAGEYKIFRDSFPDTSNNSAIKTENW